MHCLAGTGRGRTTCPVMAGQDADAVRILRHARNALAACAGGGSKCGCASGGERGRLVVIDAVLPEASRAGSRSVPGLPWTRQSAVVGMYRMCATNT